MLEVKLSTAMSPKLILSTSQVSLKMESDVPPEKIDPGKHENFNYFHEVVCLADYNMICNIPLFLILHVNSYW